MIIPIEHFLTVSALLFVIGVFGIFLNRKTMESSSFLGVLDARSATCPRRREGVAPLDSRRSFN